VLPDLVVNVTPIRTTTGPSPSETGAGITTGNGTSAITSKKSVERRIEMESGGWVTWRVCFDDVGRGCNEKKNQM
jgi:hypothetical protein